MRNSLRVYLGLGSNLGEKEENIHRAVSLLEERLGSPCSALSSLMETAPWGFESSNYFVNACARFDLDVPESEEQALRLLDICKGIEKDMGREEIAAGEGYKDRIIDIDILLFGDLKMDTRTLTIPHPLMFRREFVMLPLREIMENELYLQR